VLVAQAVMVEESPQQAVAAVAADTLKYFTH
jgi:hypothetical protein